MSYWDEAKEDDSISPQYQAYMQTLEPSSPPALVMEVVQAMEKWAPPTLRQYALDMLFEKLSNWFMAQWGTLSEDQEKTIDAEVR